MTTVYMLFLVSAVVSILLYCAPKAAVSIYNLEETREGHSRFTNIYGEHSSAITVEHILVHHIGRTIFCHVIHKVIL